MISYICTSVLVLSAYTAVISLKTCKKIDACRCSTDEGEINLWSLAAEKSQEPRFRDIEEVVVSTNTSTTTDTYQWNPCNPWTAKNHGNTSQTCQDVAVCQTQEIPPFGTYHRNIGEQKLTDCVLDQKTGQCQLTYGVSGNKQIKTSITLVCNETEPVGRVGKMRADLGSKFYTTLFAKCACPGKCSGLGTGAFVGIVLGSFAAFLLLAFVIFVFIQRRKLPDTSPKPSVCASMKVGCILLCSPCKSCCKRGEYDAISGATTDKPVNTHVKV